MRRAACPYGLVMSVDSEVIRQTAASGRRDQGLGRLARLVLRHRKLVGFGWLAVALLGLALVGPIAGRLTSAESLPGLPSTAAAEAVLHTYGNGGDSEPAAVVVSLPSRERVESPLGRRELAATLAPLANERGLRVADYVTSGDPRFVSPSGTASLALVYGDSGSPSLAQVARSLRAAAPLGVTVSVVNVGDLSGAPDGGGLGVLGETVLGGLGALAVMMLIFGWLLALLPLLVAVVSILATFLGLGAITTVTQVSQLVEYLVSLIGLGIAIDYSLLVVTRWREERAGGRANDDAVVAAMTSAGKAVAYSGITVAVGLVSLVLLPIPFMRSLGYGGLLIPLVTVFTALTLLPLILASFGPRLDRRFARHAARGRERALGTPGRAWSTWARGVVRHRGAALAAGLVLLGVLLAAASQLRAGEPSPTSLARGGSAAAGLAALERDGFPTGVLQPMEVLVANQADAGELARLLGALPGVDTAYAPSAPGWRRNGTALVDVLPDAPTSQGDNPATVAAVRRMVARFAPGSEVAGDGPDEADLLHAFYDRFPLIVALVALVTFLALAWAFGSVLLALKALLLNVLSVGAAYGALVLVWQEGYGSSTIWGIPRTGVVVDFVPLVLFAFLFGLSMDYEVFILSRIKDAYDAGMPIDEAIADGLGRTGRLVTSAALILFLAFAALASGPIVELKVFATGMGVGILLDATVVRSLLVPALVSFLGPRLWHRRARPGLHAPAVEERPVRALVQLRPIDAPVPAAASRSAGVALLLDPGAPPAGRSGRSERC